MTCRFIIICFLLAFTTLTCSKEDNNLDITYGKIYLKKDIKPIGQIHVYNINGEIKDPNTIAQFKDNLEIYTRDYLDAYSNYQYLDTIYFHNATEASLSYFGTYRSYVVTSDKSFRILTNKEITLNVSDNAPCSETFDYRISKYQSEILDTELISSVRGVYIFHCQVRQKLAFNTVNNALTSSIFIYVIRDRVTQSETSGWSYNELKNDFYKELDPGKEFAYQQLIVSYQ